MKVILKDLYSQSEKDIEIDELFTHISKGLIFPIEDESYNKWLITYDEKRKLLYFLTETKFNSSFYNDSPNKHFLFLFDIDIEFYEDEKINGEEKSVVDITVKYDLSKKKETEFLSFVKYMITDLGKMLEFVERRDNH